MKTLKHFIAVLAALMLVACGGGEQPATLSAQKFAPQSPQSTTTVTPAQAAEQLLNAAEGAYPGLFPGHQTTLSYAPFAFRYYPETNMYIGVVVTTGTAYTSNGIYVVGTGFGTLASPGYQGLVTQYLTNLSIVDPVVTTNKTLVITGTVSVAGTTVAIPTTTVPNVPAPTVEGEFCGVIGSNSTYSQIFAVYSGTLTINSCSFSGSVGTLSATITSSSLPFPVSFVATYTFQ